MGEARIRITVAELTTADGRTSGHVTTSVTEGGQTTIRRRDVDSAPEVRLTEAQRDVLTVLGSVQSRIYSPCISQIGFALGRRKDWARSHVYRLLRSGLVESTGTGCIPQRWRLTPAGRAALAQAERAEGENRWDAGHG